MTIQTTIEVPEYLTIDDIKRISSQTGHHYFNTGTMRIFKSRVLDEVYQGKGGIYFVTSEKFVPTWGPPDTRKYTVRTFDRTNGSVGTLGQFNKLSKERAKRIARIAAEYPEAAKEALEV